MSVSQEDIDAAFDAFDADGSGFIDAKEISKVCEQLGVDASGAEIAELIAQADTDGDGKISKEEFSKSVIS